MKNIKAVFFDLDHTLWDFDTNSRETLQELYVDFKLEEIGVISSLAFIESYIEINHRMWDQYDNGVITKEFLRTGRFQEALSAHNVYDNILVDDLASSYLSRCPLKGNVMKGTFAILDYLSDKYELHIITNGFLEVQHIKLKSGQLADYFKHIHISEEVGYKKPHRKIFDHAVRLANTDHDRCVMIGDNPATDIKGALNAGVNAVLFDPEEKHKEVVNAEKVTTLTELVKFL